MPAEQNREDETWRRLCRMASAAESASSSSPEISDRAIDQALRRLAEDRAGIHSGSLGGWNESLAWRVAIGAVAASLLLLLADWQLLRQAFAADVPPTELEIVSFEEPWQ